MILLLLAPSVPLAAQTDQPRVAGVRFEGNQSFSDGQLAGAIATRETECRNILLSPLCLFGSDWAERTAFFDPATFRRDVARIQLFYYQRGYRETAVDTLVDRPRPDRVEITFRIREGRPVRVDSVAVVGLEGVLGPEAREEVTAELPLRRGEPLSALLIEASRDSLRARLRNRGFAHADVLRRYLIPSDRPYSARVTFDVLPGSRTVIGPIAVLGNQEVSETVIRRMLPFQEGELYRQGLIFNAQRNLFNLDIFRHAEIVPDLAHDPDSVVPLRIQVNEGDVHRVGVGWGWNNADCFNTESTWASRNFQGGARRLEVRGRLSNILAPDLNDNVCDESGSGEFDDVNWHLSTEFLQPWLFSPDLALSAEVFGERQSLKNVFVRRAVGFNLSLIRSLDPTTSLSLSFRPERSRLDAAEIFFCTSFLVCDPADIDVVQSSNWLSPLVLSLARDRSNRVLNPTRGYTLRLELEHASDITRSDFAYNRVVGETSRFFELPDRWVAAFRLRGGWATPEPFGERLAEAGQVDILHPQKRFFAGGSNSVRGFSQNQLGPRVLSVPVSVLLGPMGGVCTPEEVVDLRCDAMGIRRGRFTPRPTGGSKLLEGTAELRFPLIGSRTEGALFLDVGQVWAEGEPVSLQDLEFAPGFGLRYFTPIGPVRLDVGYRLERTERLSVVTTLVRPFDPSRDLPVDRLTGPDGEPIPWVPSEELGILEPRVGFEDSGTFGISRIQIHLSIGQAF